MSRIYLPGSPPWGGVQGPPLPWGEGGVRGHLNRRHIALVMKAAGSNWTEWPPVCHGGSPASPSYRTGTRLKPAVRLSGLIDRRPLWPRTIWFAGATRGRYSSVLFHVAAHGCPAHVGGKRRRARGGAGRGAPACGSWAFLSMPPSNA